MRRPFLLFALMAMALLVSGGVALAATFEGTNDADTISGTDRSDTMEGYEAPLQMPAGSSSMLTTGE